jgi:bifunctional DNA-binding transcriptional regulator/antitoxin component of YhaV-PrlF toxin-antitoxin module
MGIREQKTFEIKLREGGNLIIPKFLRDVLHLEPGQTLRAARVANAIVLSPQRMDLDALRQQMRGLMKEHGVTGEDVLLLYSRPRTRA